MTDPSTLFSFNVPGDIAPNGTVTVTVSFAGTWPAGITEIGFTIDCGLPSGISANFAVNPALAAFYRTLFHTAYRVDLDLYDNAGLAAIPNGVLGTFSFVVPSDTLAGNYHVVCRDIFAQEVGTWNDVDIAYVSITGVPAYTPPAPSNPVITTVSFPTGYLGIAYTTSLAAADGIPPYTFSLESGSLPPGLSLAPDGTISGTPLAVGTPTPIFRVTDAVAASSVSAPIPLAIAPQSVSISPSGTAYLHLFQHLDLTATVHGPADQHVAWTATPNMGSFVVTGDNTASYIPAAGRYYPNGITITATSVANPSLSGSILLQVYSPSNTFQLKWKHSKLAALATPPCMVMLHRPYIKYGMTQFFFDGHTHFIQAFPSTDGGASFNYGQAYDAGANAYPYPLGTKVDFTNQRFYTVYWSARIPGWLGWPDYDPSYYVETWLTMPRLTYFDFALGVWASEILAFQTGMVLVNDDFPTWLYSSDWNHPWGTPDTGSYPVIGLAESGGQYHWLEGDESKWILHSHLVSSAERSKAGGRFREANYMGGAGTWDRYNFPNENFETPDPHFVASIYSVEPAAYFVGQTSGLHHFFFGQQVPTYPNPSGPLVLANHLWHCTFDPATGAWGNFQELIHNYVSNNFGWGPKAYAVGDFIQSGNTICGLLGLESDGSLRLLKFRDEGSPVFDFSTVIEPAGFYQAIPRFPGTIVWSDIYDLYFAFYANFSTATNVADYGDGQVYFRVSSDLTNWSPQYSLLDAPDPPQFGLPAAGAFAPLVSITGSDIVFPQQMMWVNPGTGEPNFAYLDQPVGPPPGPTPVTFSYVGSGGAIAGGSAGTFFVPFVVRPGGTPRQSHLHPGLKCVHNSFDECLAEELEAAGKVQIKELCPMVQTRGFYPGMPEVEIPAQGRPLNWASGILAPLPASGFTEVFSRAIPPGYDVILKAVYQLYTGPLDQGSGDLVWQLQIGRRYGKTLGSTTVQLGSPQSMFILSGSPKSGIKGRSGQTVRYLVKNTDAAKIPPGGAERILCGVRGWIYPRR